MLPLRENVTWTSLFIAYNTDVNFCKDIKRVSKTAVPKITVVQVRHKEMETRNAKDIILFL